MNNIVNSEPRLITFTKAFKTALIIGVMSLLAYSNREYTDNHAANNSDTDLDKQLQDAWNKLGHDEQLKILNGISNFIDEDGKLKTGTFRLEKKDLVILKGVRIDLAGLLEQDLMARGQTFGNSMTLPDIEFKSLEGYNSALSHLLSVSQSANEKLQSGKVDFKLVVQASGGVIFLKIAGEDTARPLIELKYRNRELSGVNIVGMSTRFEPAIDQSGDIKPVEG